jgi:hypothetical protein
MQFRRSALGTSIVSLLGAFLLFGSIHTHAQATKSTDVATFRVGLKSIAITAPSTELVETGSDYRVLLDTLTPVNNRLIAAFLLPADLKAIQTGTTSALSRYALVEVPRRAEFASITPEFFKQLAGSLGKEFDASLDAKLKDQQDEINRRMKALSASPTTVTLDKPVMLGSFFSKRDAEGFGGVMPIDVNGKKSKMAMGLTVVRIQERVLFLYLYTSYTDEESVNWVRTSGDKWADAILAANK